MRKILFSYLIFILSIPIAYAFDDQESGISKQASIKVPTDHAKNIMEKMKEEELELNRMVEILKSIKI